MKSNEKIANKNKLLLGIVAVFAVVGLITTIIRQIDTILTKVEFPEGIISEEKESRPYFNRPDYLSMAYTCKNLPLKIYLPGQVDFNDNTAKSIFEGVTFVVLEGSEDPLYLNQVTLPAKVNVPILGYKNKVEFHRQSEGYCYDFTGEYFATTVTTKVSTKKVTTYALCYYLNLSSSEQVAFYASVEDPALLAYADEMLSEIIRSIEQYDRDDDVEEVQTSQKPSDNKAEEERLKFDVTIDGDGPHDNAVLVFEWTNAKVEPTAIEVTGPNGQAGVLNKEYSVPGHYVFEFGYATAGEYHIVGETEEVLKECEINVSSWEGYMDVDHYYENPENIRPREG